MVMFYLTKVYIKAWDWLHDRWCGCFDDYDEALYRAEVSRFYEEKGGV